MKLTWPTHVILLKNDDQVHETAVIDVPCEIEENARIWHFAHVMENAKIGAHTTIGQGVHVARGVQIGERCRVQNGAQLFTGVEIGDDVFIGPHVVFTNVLTPRAFVDRKAEFKPTVVGRGASIGANATILCGISIGEYAMIGAGSVVTKDVAPHELVYGNPAAFHGLVCRCGVKLLRQRSCWAGEDVPLPPCACGSVWRRTCDSIELVP